MPEFGRIGLRRDGRRTYNGVVPDFAAQSAPGPAQERNA